MQSIASSRSPCSIRGTSRRPTVVVRADWVSEAFTKVFTPQKASPTVSVDYTGRPTRGRKPFRDGFVGSKQATSNPASRLASASAVSAAKPVDNDESVKADGPLEYIGGAIRRLMSNNYTQEENRRSTGISGLKGSIRQGRRSGKGYHSTSF